MKEFSDSSATFIFLQNHHELMKDSKIRRTSSDSKENEYKDYSMLPLDRNNDRKTEGDRIFMSVQRDELPAVKKAYVEASKPVYDEPVEKRQPKGMYFDSKSKVVDNYASNSDWRERIRKAVAESEKTVNPPAADRKPWPEAAFERNKPAVDDKILWEIDDIKKNDKPIARDKDYSPVKSEKAKPVRAEAYAVWLAERNARIEKENENLIRSVSKKQKKQKLADVYEKWMAERKEKVGREEAELKKRIAEKQKRQKLAEVHEKWAAEREEKVGREEAELKKRIAEKQKRQKLAEVHEKWAAEREEKVGREEAELKKRIAEKQKRQKLAEVHEKWAAEREEKVGREEAELRKRIAEKQRTQRFAGMHNKWITEREKRIEEEAEDLEKRIFVKRNEAAKAEIEEREKEAEKTAAETVRVIEEKPDAEAKVVIEIEPTDEAKPKSEIPAEKKEADEEYDNDLQILLKEKKELEQLRMESAKREGKQKLDDEFVV